MSLNSEPRNHFHPDDHHERNFVNAILDTIDALVLVHDTQGRIVRFNRACERLSGYSFEEVKGKHFADLFLLPEEYLGVEEKLADLYAGATAIHHENHWMTKDGELRRIRWSSTSLKGSIGAVEYIVATGIDITEREQAVAALRETENRYRNLFYSHHIPMLLIDAETMQIVSTNAAASEFYGWSAEELKQMKISDINTLPFDKVRDEMAKARAAGGRRKFYFKHRLANGEIRDVEVHSGPYHYGDRSYLFSIIHDVTEAKRFQDEIISISRFPNEGPFPVMRFTKDGQILYANNASADLLRCWGVQLSGKIPDEILPTVAKVIRTKTPKEIEHKCGEMIFNLLFNFIEGEDYVNVYGRDITKRVLAEEELKAYTEKLKTANRELQDFAYIASHDLQEPLRKIQAFGERLQTRYASQLNDEGVDYIRRMTGAARRMNAMLKGLLDYSRVTTQAQPYERVSLATLLKDVLSDLEIRLEQTKGEVTTGPLPSLEADPTQMRLLFQNLISNALKFHAPGQPPKIHITTKIIDTEALDGGPYAKIMVSDDGIGFDEAYAERIFQPFQRLHGANEFEGHGMGLAICRKIVERHRGTITAKSETGKGSTFIICLPVTQKTD